MGETKMVDAVNRIAPEFKTLMSKYNVNVPGLTEAIWQPKFDRLTYDAAGHTQLRFFQTPIGQGTASEESTNMVSAGVIAAPQQFLVTGIRMRFIPDASLANIQVAAADAAAYANDVQAVVNSGVVVFTVGNKEQNRDAPIGKMPPSHRICAEGSMADSTIAAVDAVSTVIGVQSVGQLYNITPTNIPYSQNFDVTVKWDTPTALPSGNNGTLECHLEGFLYRSAQ
jgi:hypothetical protein